jgi:hypothetical protein
MNDELMALLNSDYQTYLPYYQTLADNLHEIKPVQRKKNKIEHLPPSQEVKSSRLLIPYPPIPSTLSHPQSHDTKAPVPPLTYHSPPDSPQ